MSFDLISLIGVGLLGGALGFAGGLFGIGGGIVAVPVLALLFGMPQPVAQGTALVMMVPNLLIACWRYARRDPIPLWEGLGIAFTATFSTWLSAQVANSIDQELLRAFFAVFLLLVAARMFFQTRSDAQSRAIIDRRFSPLVGIAGGLSMGLLGVGGGLVTAPLFSRLFNLPQRVSQSLGLVVVTPSALIALSAYAGHGNVDWLTGLCLAASGAVTVSSGVTLAHKLPDRQLKLVFSAMMTVTAAWLLVGHLLKA